MPYYPAIKVIWHPSSHRESLASQMITPLSALEGISIDHPSEIDAVEQIIADLGDSPGLLVIAGGDGSVHAAVNAMMKFDSKRTLAVLPLGTGNDLARSLGMPFDPIAAVNVLQTGTVKNLDILKFETPQESGWCVNMITGGNTGRYLEQMTDDIKERWGILCYLRGVVDVIQNLETFEVSLEIDGQPAASYSALNVFLANGRTSGGGLVVSADARLDDGLLDILLIREGTPGLIAELTANYLLSDIRQHDLVDFMQAKKVRLDAKPPLVLTSDGDSIGSSPITLEVIPAALRVLIPVLEDPSQAAFD